ncbi:GtrA family protein [Microcella daejeonensis]|uniref:GtrA family protein n=1 Tax=Microcella daejeonensis TaxID=2994971 RepID=A0A9E8S9U2_9MICO|nr:GtrA family protein [Microcella daejeonensis]WAB81876.1 GtrA family protein [Microcella daejeonensis]
MSDVEKAGADGGQQPPPSSAGMSGPPGPLLRFVRDERVAFLIVGAANTAIGFLWFTLFLYTVGPFWGYMSALVLSHIAAVLCAFVLYRRFVFRVRGNTLRDLMRFESVYLVALAINAMLLPVLVEFAGVPPLLAQALIVFVTTLVSYFGHRNFSFRRRGGRNP